VALPEPLVAFLVVYGVIAGLELVDRTNFAVLGLAAKNSPRTVWAGASSAFLLTSALSVTIGSALVALLHGSLQYLRVGGGIFLLGYAGYLLLVPEHERAPPQGRTVFASAFLLILLLELADTTMIYTILAVTWFPAEAIVVFVAAALALSSVAAVGSTVGHHMRGRIPPALLDRVVAVLLLGIGVLTIVIALDPGLLAALA
jgi:Ca2+/H+ antiporter, TMEM165/GDT1 family